LPLLPLLRAWHPGCSRRDQPDSDVRGIETEDDMKKAAILVALLILAACSSDNPTTPNPVGPPIAGTFTGYRMWLVQWNRSVDGAIGSFTCDGSLTLSQSGGNGGSSQLTGFLVVGQPCPAMSFDLTGTVQGDGSIQFISGGAKPPVGQCPAASYVQYSGVVTHSGTTWQLSARGNAMLNCPGPGEGPQQMEYILSAYKSG
jgi:hypothetical protein